jgi:hypothetical protein
LIDGFESPFGMELLATVDWLLSKEATAPTVEAVREGLQRWPAGAAPRKTRLFDERVISIALKRLTAKGRQAVAGEPGACLNRTSRGDALADFPKS